MSRYLVDRISHLPNVEVITRAEVTGLEGRDGRLEAIRWRNNGQEERCELNHLFLFIGEPPVPVHRRRPEHRLAARLRREARW
jgi:thioredoxin reductase (NADPH)